MTIDSLFSIGRGVGLGYFRPKKSKGQFSWLLALVLTAGTAVTALAVSGLNATNFTEASDSSPMVIDAAPELQAVLFLPQNLTRDADAIFRAVVTNAGNSTAEIVDITWRLSPGMQTVNQTGNCSAGLAPNESCWVDLTVRVGLDTPLGITEIGGEVRHG